MRKTMVSIGALVTVLTLSGCSVFYPNWGATGLPEEPEITITSKSTDAQSISPSESQDPAQTQEPESSAEPAESAEEVVERTKVSVDIVMATVEPDFGVLTVIAQIPGISENGGKCIFRFVGSDKEAVLEVKAEESSAYTQCFPIEFPLTDLPSGNGIVTVAYESAKHFGLSAASSVVIP